MSQDERRTGVDGAFKSSVVTGRAEPDLVQILEAVPAVAREYGIAAGDLRPCVAFLLDANLGGADRHSTAFVIAIELRRLGWTPEQVLSALRRWATKIGYPDRGCRSAAASAFERRNGDWRYHPPGLIKRPGTKYFSVLGPICVEVGCPQYCGPFQHAYRGPDGEGWKRFEALGWRAELHRRRHSAGIDVYLALCLREEELGFACGAPLLTSYSQLAEIAHRDPRTVGRALAYLQTDGLVSFTPGRGSGPCARDRVPSRVQRVVPIPTPAASPDCHGAITTEGVR